MERKLKERLVGATVIVALGIIIIPWLLDGPAQAPRPVETTIDLPAVEAPGRTYTIPLDPGAGPPVQVEDDPRRLDGPGTGAVQRPAPAEPAPLDVNETEPPPAVTEQPVQPPPRPAPQETTPAADTGAVTAPVKRESSPPQAKPKPAAQATAPPAAVQNDAWSVQVGSFSQVENAQGLQKRLVAAGFDAFVSRVVTDAGTLYRVRVGPVPDRAAADRLLARVRAAGHTTARAVRVED